MLSQVFGVYVLIPDWQNPVRCQGELDSITAGLLRGGAAQGKLAPDGQKQGPVPAGPAALEVSALFQSEWDMNKEEGKTLQMLLISFLNQKLLLVVILLYLWVQ